MRRTPLIPFLTLVIAASLGVAGCGSGGGTPVNPNTTISVVIYPGAPTVPVNGTIDFSAVVYNFTTNGGVNFKATAGTFAGSVFTAPSTTGPVTVTATSQEDTTKSASVTVTVSAAQPLAVTPAAIALAALGTQAFAATSATPITWSVTANGADPGTIDQSGNYTAPRTPPPGGVVTVTATSAAARATQASQFCSRRRR